METVGKATMQLWISYRNFVYSRIQLNESSRIRDIPYWRDRLFRDSVLYSLPVSFVASVPAMIVSLKEQDYYSFWISISTITLLTVLSLNRFTSVKQKKTMIAVLIYAFGTVITILQGYNGPGVIYLFASTVFIVLIFSEKLGYISIALHLVVSLLIAFLILTDYHQFWGIEAYQMKSWIVISTNLLFLSIISVLIISRLINGLDATINKEFRLRDNLARKVATIEAHNVKLKEIAYIQSHIVRAPLASSIGLIELLKLSPEEKPDPEVILHLETTIRALDDMVKAIIKNSYKI